MNEQQMCTLLENLLNKAGRSFTDSELDRIGDTFGDLMMKIFG